MEPLAHINLFPETETLKNLDSKDSFEVSILEVPIASGLSSAFHIKPLIPIRKTILMIHDLGNHDLLTKSDWISKLLQKGYSILYFLWDGHSKKYKTELDFALFLQTPSLVQNYMESQLNINYPLVLLAQGMGCYLALGACLSFPEKIDKVFLINPHKVHLSNHVKLRIGIPLNVQIKGFINNVFHNLVSQKQVNQSTFYIKNFSKLNKSGDYIDAPSQVLYHLCQRLNVTRDYWKPLFQEHS